MRGHVLSEDLALELGPLAPEQLAEIERLLGREIELDRLLLGNRAIAAA